jgi:hypothetical protein
MWMELWMSLAFDPSFSIVISGDEPCDYITIYDAQWTLVHGSGAHD